MCSPAQGWPGCATAPRPPAAHSRSPAPRTVAPPSKPAFPPTEPPMPDRHRVLIAEDHYLVREGTRHLLEDSDQVDVLAAVSTAEELLDAVERLQPKAVITDIRMPPNHHTEGITAAHTIRT